MDNPYKIQAREWLERGVHDVEMARLMFEAEGYTDTIGFIIQQGMEKCLKALLVVNQTEPPRTHDLKVLLNKVSSYLKSATAYYDACLIATKYYIEDRYPPGPVNLPPRKEISIVLDKAVGLMDEIKELIEQA